jgi:hypothetical protein
VLPPRLSYYARSFIAAARLLSCLAQHQCVKHSAVLSRRFYRGLPARRWPADSQNHHIIHMCLRCKPILHRRHPCLPIRLPARPRSLVLPTEQMPPHGARPSSSSTCASRTLSPLSLEPARASTMRRTPTTCSGKIACGPYEQHRSVSCSALLLHHSSRRHPGLTTVLFDPGWAPFPGDGTSTCLLLYIGSASRTCSHLVPRRHDLVARSLSSLQKRAQAASSDRRCRCCYGNMRIR